MSWIPPQKARLQPGARNPILWVAFQAQEQGWSSEVGQWGLESVL